MSNSHPTATTNKPVYSFLTVVVFAASLVALYLTGHADDGGVFIALVVSTLPSLVAAIASERTARDIRNGVVQDKARQGAHEAISEAEVLTRPGPVVQAHLEAQTAQLAALTTILGDVKGKQADMAATVETLATGEPS